MRLLGFASAGLLGVVIAGSHCGGASSSDVGSGSSGGAASGGGGNSGRPSSGAASGDASGAGAGAASGDASGAASGDASGIASGDGSGASAGSSSGSGATSGGASGATSGGSGSASGATSGGGSGRVDGGSTCLGATCGHQQTCCGTQCCNGNQLCCLIGGPVPPVDPFYCFTPTASQPTCPKSCSPKCVSDRNLKRDIQPVDERAVLQSIARLPVSTWSYKSDPPAVRHLGPMAQDFHAAFGLGDTDRAYDSIDAHGVSMAAIKALYEELQDQQARIERLERENEELRAHAPYCPTW